MVLISLVREYIGRMLQDISGMKVLILDSETVKIVSVAYSQSELLQKEVFLVELVDSMSKESMAHMKAVYFLRPTSENIQNLRHHLANPRFGEYHLFFSNALKVSQIQVLADADEHEVVQQVQEFFADFSAIDPCHFTLNLHINHMYMLPTVADPPSSQSFCDRIVDGIAAVFLALKRRPVIRYQRTSDVAKRIAQETAKLMYEQESGLFDFRRNETSPLLLVIDRRDDPVTPLLTQWTYQLVQFLLKQAGVDKRTGDLYGNRDLLNIARNMARGLKGVENVYTQHQPLLFQSMENIIKGRLRDIDYPFIGNHFQRGRFLKDLEEAQKIARSSNAF